LPSQFHQNIKHPALPEGLLWSLLNQVCNMLNLKSMVLILVIVAAIAVIFFFFVVPKLPTDFIQVLMTNRLAMHEFSKLVF
jgi:hypothetical protein